MKFILEIWDEWEEIHKLVSEFSVYAACKEFCSKFLLNLFDN